MKRRWQNIDQLIGKLRGLVWAQRALRSGAGLLLLGASMVAIWTTLTFFAAVSILPVWFKVGALSLSLSAIIWFNWRWVFAPLFEGDIDSVAARLEKRYDTLKGRLIAAVQFKRDPDSLPRGTSPELVDLTARQTLELTEKLQLEKSLDYSKLSYSWKPTLAASAMFALVMLLAPGFYGHAFRVYSSPLTEIAPPLGYQISATPSGGKAIRFRDLDLTGHLTGIDFPKEASVHYKFEGGTWQKQKFTLKNARITETDSGDSLSFNTHLRDVKRSLEFYVAAGRRKTEVTTIEVVDLPRVTSVKLSIVAPEYTKLPPVVIDENNGSFAAVVGSRARADIGSNVPLSQAQLIIDNNQPTELAPVGTRFSAELPVDANHSYRLRMVDSLGEENPDPIEYSITAIEDRAPQVTVTQPGIDVDLEESLFLPLKVSISDDFGFSSLVMKYSIVSDGNQSDETVVVIHFSDNIKTDGEVEFDWDVSKTGIRPGDYLAYYFEIWDNDEVSGYKQSRSRIYHARLPSIEELIAEMDTESRDRIESTENILEQERKLHEKLEDAQRKLRELKSDESLDWQKKKSLEEMVQKNDELMNQLEEMAKNMDRELQNRDGSRLLNQEMMEKLKRIQELFDEIATDEMREAQKRMQEALEKMDKDKLESAMEDFELSQKEMLDRLERTLELLKRMQIEQKINAMTEAAKELLDRQMDNNEKTDKSEEENLPELAKEEEKIKESFENLKKEADELEEMLEDSQLEDNPQLKEFADAVKQSDADQDMGDMEEQLSQKQKKEAGQSGDKAEKKLQEMLDSMREKQQAFAGQQSSEMNSAIRRAIEDATYLSREQEELLGETAGLNPRSTALRQLTGEQETLKQSVGGFGERIVALSAKNPFLSSDLRTIISDALSNIDESVERLGNTRGQSATNSQRDAMTKLNEAALRLLESMEDQSQCNKGGSCDKAGQKMESLSERQKRLNRETEKQLGKEGNGGKENPGVEELKRLRELAGEQRAIQRSMEELQKEFGSRDQILGDLDALGKEMDKVIEDLSEGSAGGPTVDRQLRIHSRLLESIKALNRRDFTPERRAGVGADFFRASPSALGENGDNRPFEDRLQDFLKEGFPPEYEQQVRNYFKALNKLDEKNR